MQKHVETLILGAGPAGLQAGYFLDRDSRDYLILERAETAGSFFETYPRHRTLLSINKRYTGRDDAEFNLRHDWNSLITDDPKRRITEMTADYFPSADVLVEYLQAFADELELNIAYRTHVSLIERRGAGFTLSTRAGDSYTCDRLLIATGLAESYVPEVEGIDLTTSYEDMSLDPDDFANKSVLIIGKGNSAFETADHLIASASIIHLISPTPLRLAWESRFVGHLRAVNNNMLDTYHLKSQNAIIDGEIHRIWRNPETGKLVIRFNSIHVDNETEQLEYDHIIRCTGWRFDDSIFADDCKPEPSACGRLPEMDNDWQSKNIPHLYFAGSNTQLLDHKRAQSAFIHGFRYNVRSLIGLLEHRYHGVSLDAARLPVEPVALAEGLLERLNRVSSLWQQVGFLADLIVLEEHDARLIPDLPFLYLREHGAEFAGGRPFLISMFRLGHCPKNPFDHGRSTDPSEGTSSTAIHPVISYHDASGALVDEFHVLEDFLADWSSADYCRPLAAFLQAKFEGASLELPKLKQTRHIVRDHEMRLVK